MGIPDDLIQDIAIRELAFGAGTLHAAVASYVQSPRYYRALIAGGARYNLNGQPCGEVTPQEQKEAETRLMMLNDRRKDRKRCSLSCNQCTALYRAMGNTGHNR
ncbi:ProQ/FINO family protein [Escherichia coli]|nr:ProQ/FINO family protein [Escherichia coli]